MRLLSPPIEIAVASLFAAGLAWAAAPEKSAPAQQAAKSPEEVVVEATRLEELKRRVYSYVSGITHRGYRVDSLARWNQPICPMVAGIPRAQGEFILRRLSQTVVEAGAPLGARKCRPNFHVVMVSEPEQLLDLWRKRAPRLFGGSSPTSVRRVMSKARPIRVWYNVSAVCREGQQQAQAAANGGLAMTGALPECHIEDTRLEWNYVTAVSSVIVLVDLDDIKDVRIGPLTDYIAMVGLAKVDLDGDRGDAPTVLGLFAKSAESSPTAAPQGMSPWDRAFLKALYSTAQDSRFQRSMITEQMVRGFTSQ